MHSLFTQRTMSQNIPVFGTIQDGWCVDGEKSFDCRGMSARAASTHVCWIII